MRDDLEGSWPEIEREVKSTRTRTAGELQPGKDGKEKDPEKSEGKKWRKSRKTITEKDLVEDGNIDQRMSKIKGRGIK